jgi:hypothetical protein
MDTVFLSGFLKKGYSQARVVATPGDLLLSRDADDVSLLHGVMALTTYSLLPGIKDEVAFPESLPETRISHIFPSAFNVGTYNATLAQITCMHSSPPPGCTDSSTTLPVARYAEYGWPLLSGYRNDLPLAPVVWLTVLGRDGFWPVANLEDGTYREGKIHASPRPITKGERPASMLHPLSKEFPTWSLFWKTVCGMVLLMAAVYWLLLREGSIFSSSSAMTLLAPVQDSRRSALIAVIGWLLLAAMLLLVWPCVAWLAWKPWPEIFILAAAIFAVVHCRICVTELNRRGSARDGRVFIAVAASMVLCFGLVYVLPGHSQNPFLYRYVHLTSGVSPLLPFLCLLAGGLWWAWFSLSGLGLVDKRRPQLPNDEDLPSAAPPDHTAASVTRSHSMLLSEKSAERLVHVAQPAALDLRVYGPAVALLMLTLFSLDRFHPLLSLETGHFEWIYALSLAGVTFALVCTLLRLLVIWQESHKILATLDHFPLRRAFAQLHFAWEPIWRIGGGRWQDLYRLISRQLETLEHLKPFLREDHGVAAGVLLRGIEATANQQEELYQHYAALTSPSCQDPNAKEPKLSDYLMDQYQLLQKSIAYTCAAALTYLQPKWWGSEGLIMCELGSNEEGNAPGEDDKKADGTPAILLPTRLAERFAALVYLNFILTILLRMKTLAITAGGLYIFLLLSVNSYPFEPKIALRSIAILMLIVVVGMVGYVFAQVHRDSILSLVTQTKPGELGVAFWLRMGSFVALPLISLLASQFPTLNNALFFWLEPAVSALK